MPTYILVPMVAPKAPVLLYSTMQTMRELQSNSSMAMTGMVVNLKFVRIDLPVWDHLVEVDSAVVAVVALAEAALAMEVEVEVSEAVETSVEALEADMEEVVVGMAAVVVVPVVALVALIKAVPNLSPQMPSPTLLREVENETQSSMLKM